MGTRIAIDHLFEQARSHWLKPADVLFILQNHDSNLISQHAPQLPTSGSLFLFNKNVIPSFRRDGHNWRKQKHKNSVKEAHERLKVGNVEALNCYYAHGEDNRNFQRRSYWMLDQANRHIVLVHYRDTTELQGHTNRASTSQFPPGILSQGVNNLIIESQGNTSLSDLHGSYQNWRCPSSLQVNSRIVDEMDQVDLSQVLQVAFDNQQDIDHTAVLGFDNIVMESNQVATWQQHDYYYSGRYDAVVSGSTNPVSWKGKGITACGTNISNGYSMRSHPGHFQMLLEADSSVTITQERKFSIWEISPEWGFADEVTKVITIGSFLCSPSETTWACMFGDIEVPIQIIRDGVICCQAPPCRSGNVTFCITSGNGKACSELKDFEYHDRNSAWNNHIKPQQENRRIEVDQLLVSFVQMLLSYSPLQKGEGNDLYIDLSSIQKGYEEPMNRSTEVRLTGCGTSSSTIDWVLQKLLEDKLQQWLSAQLLDGVGNLGCTSSEKEQGILHIVAGLGYEWALNPILGSGVGVNFQDTNGWTALHWAARFGREKMATALIANGASVGVVTHPTPQDPIGKDPASVAAANGHKDLAGYLSELELTNYCSSFAFEQLGSLCVEAVVDASNISGECVASGEDQYSMKQALAEGINIAQTAFQTHSLMKRQQREAANRSSVDAHCCTSDEIHGLSVATLTIKKYYRCWKRRSGSLTLSQKVVKIKEHTRDCGIRKYYRVVSTIGIKDKGVVRWRRKESGLRGFKQVWRGQKPGFINKYAQDQYARILETHLQAKAQLDVLTKKEALASLAGVFSVYDDDYDAFELPLEALADTPDYSELWA